MTMERRGYFYTMLIRDQTKINLSIPIKTLPQEFQTSSPYDSNFQLSISGLAFPLPSSDNGFLLGQSFLVSVKFRVLVDGSGCECIFSGVFPPYTAFTAHCCLPTLLPPTLPLLHTASLQGFILYCTVLLGEPKFNFH